MTKVTPGSPHNFEENLVRVSELLRCAAATAYETCDQLTGQKRDRSLLITPESVGPASAGRRPVHSQQSRRQTLRPPG
jgi:hypothetical protein